MTKQLGICQECQAQYEYEFNPKFPRKYCFECSAAKQQAFADANVPVVKPGIREDGIPYPHVETKPIAKPKANGYPKDPVGLVVELMVTGRDRDEAIFDVKLIQEAFE